MVVGERGRCVVRALGRVRGGWWWRRRLGARGWQRGLGGSLGVEWGVVRVLTLRACSGLVQHVLQRADVLHGHPKGIHLAELLASSATRGRGGERRRHTVGDVRTQGGETVVDLLHSIPLPSVPAGNRWRLMSLDSLVGEVYPLLAPG